MTSALETSLLAIPKVELHCHLFGTVRHDTFAQLNRSADDLYRLTIGYLPDAAAHNVRYSELFCP